MLYYLQSSPSRCSFILCIFSCFFQESKRKIAPPKAFTPVKYVIFYLQEENKYILLSSSSTLFPKDVDFETIKPLTEVCLTDKLVTFSGMFISQSESETEANTIQKRLQHYIDSGKCIDADASLAFLNDSFSSEDRADNGRDATVTDSSLPDVPVPGCSTGTIDIDGSSVEKCGKNETTREHEQGITNTLMRALMKKMDTRERILNAILNEQIKTRKVLQKAFPKKTNSGVCRETGDANNQSYESVMFNDKDLVGVGPRNLDVSRYSLRIARIMWDDEELTAGRLFPKRSNGITPLSPGRSATFKKAVISRFNLDDEDDVLPGVAAVNQLCIDLNAGKRRRV